MSRPVVAVDATLVGARSKGAGRAIKNLLATFPAVDPGFRYVALATADGAEVLERSAPDVDVVRVEMSGGLRWELDGVGAAAQRAGADVVFTVRELSPRTGPPSVVHVYEPPAYRLRGLRVTSADDVKRIAKDALLHLSLRRSLARAAAVTAGSATTAAWLRTHAHVDPTVVHPGIDPVFFAEPAGAPDVPEYALHPSTGDPRENTALVLAAFAQPDAPSLRLKLVGLPERERAVLERRARALGIADRVDLLGWVTDAELHALYRGAVALLHPTRYESFAGFPALEALALGTPVVALDAPGSTEALAGASVLLPREDPVLLARELARLVGSPALRAELSAAGRQLAEGLTWEASALKLTRVFHGVLG
jgi:glycosyltransferase involved in cell wall biosynthesis